MIEPVSALSPVDPPCPEPVTYRNRRWHLLAFHGYLFWRHRANQVLLVLLVAMNLYASGIWDGLPLRDALRPFLLGTAAWIAGVFLLQMLLLAISFSSSRNRAILTDHTISLTSTGILEQTAFNRSEIYWLAVDRVTEGRGFVYLFPSQFGAYLIPRRAFGSEERCERFVQFARLRIERAQGMGSA
jgi:hypothetical protein